MRRRPRWWRRWRCRTCRRHPWPAWRSTRPPRRRPSRCRVLTDIGLAPAATFFMPTVTMACASTVAVVVPSPAMSSVLVATSLTSWAPMFSKGSSSSISLAMDTPSLVIVGAPNFLSSTTLRPLGPMVTRTASASLLTPASSARRASSSNFSTFAIGGSSLAVECVAVAVCRELRSQRDGQLSTTASTSRLLSTSRSSPLTATSVPPYFEYRTVSPTLMSTGISVARGLGTLARTDGEDFALLRLLLGGVGDDETRCGLRLGLVRPDHDAVIQRLQVHGVSLHWLAHGGVRIPLGLMFRNELALDPGECQG